MVSFAGTPTRQSTLAPDEEIWTGQLAVIAAKHGITSPEAGMLLVPHDTDLRSQSRYLQPCTA